MSDVAALGSSRAGSKGSGDPDEIVQQTDGQPRISSPKRKAAAVAAASQPAMESNLNGAPALTSSDPRMSKQPNGIDKREKDPKRTVSAPPKRDDAKRQSGVAQNGKEDHSGGDRDGPADPPADSKPAAPRPKKDSPPIEKASYLGTSWVLGKKLGEGSFGEIYQALNEKDPNDEVAVKLGRGEGKDMLQREAKILYTLRGYHGVPEIRACYTEGEWCVMAMQLLGASLSDLLLDYEITLKVVLILADQMIQHLEYIHSKNIIHGDLKPSNFLLGRGERRNQVVLIDFGLCEEYRNPETKKHIPFSDKHGFHGTPRYCSLHVHNGIASSRRDDMESLGYVLVYMMLGKLPWQNLPAEENETKKQKRRKIAEMKQSLPVEELCAGLPDEFATYINITRNLKFKQKPNYYALRMLFRDLFMRSEYGSYDDDWIATLERKKKRRPRSQGEGGPTASGNAPNVGTGLFSPAGMPPAVGKNPAVTSGTYHGARTVPVGGSHVVATTSRSPRVPENNGKKPSGISRFFSFLTHKETPEERERHAKEKLDKEERKREKREAEEREKKEKIERRKSMRESKRF